MTAMSWWAHNRGRVEPLANGLAASPSARLPTAGTQGGRRTVTVFSQTLHSARKCSTSATLALNSAAPSVVCVKHQVLGPALYLCALVSQAGGRDAMWITCTYTSTVCRDTHIYVFVYVRIAHFVVKVTSYCFTS